MADFLVSIPALQRNTQILREVRDAAGCQLVLALKGFACWKAFPFIRDDLDGCCASGLWEARLANEHFGKKVITYSPAYTESDIDQLIEFAHHIDFNSLNQWLRFREKIVSHRRFQSGELLCGLRINPEHSTGATPLYDPCVPGSRLGLPAASLEAADLEGISGLHFHTLCEQNSDDLESTLKAVDEKFGALLKSPAISYLNLGGGHWITKADYDREKLVELVQEVQARYNVDVWLEPGEAIAIHTGVLRSQVLDVFESQGYRHAILDVSATGHMPDVLEMPYRPEVFLAEASNAPSPAPDGALPAACLTGERYTLAGSPDDERSTFIHRLGGPTCLAGDVIGDYAFPRALAPGDTLVFDDMAHYTMVKTTTFNGVKHPSISLLHHDGRVERLRDFTYEDFRDRLS